jgi:hypothetical protein
MQFLKLNDLYVQVQNIRFFRVLPNPGGSGQATDGLIRIVLADGMVLDVAENVPALLSWLTQNSVIPQ